MGRLFQALRTLFKGFVSIFIGDLATANPEAAYEGLIQTRLEERERIMRAAGELRAELNLRRGELGRAERELADTERQLKVAVQGNRAQAGSLLIRKKEQLTRAVAQLRPQVEQLSAADRRTVAQIQQFNQSIVELREKARINVARLRSADAQRRILDRIAGLSIRGDDQMEQAIDRAVESRVGQVEIGQEVAGSDVETQLAEVQAETAAAAGLDEFQALRAAYDAQHGGTQTETPTGGGSGSDGGKVA